MIEVAKQLRTVEVLMDQVFAATGRLMTSLITARIDQGISPVVGKNIRPLVSDVAVHISNGQARAADLHRMLEAVAKARGLDVTAFGDEDKNAPDVLTKGG